MTKKLLLALPLVLLPSLAFAQRSSGGPGSGTDLTKVQREVEAMQRDGRWEKLLAEGRANRLAFEAMRQAEEQARSGVVFMAVSPTRQRRRP
jgi:hypothetical protein